LRSHLFNTLQQTPTPRKSFQNKEIRKRNSPPREPDTSITLPKQRKIFPFGPPTKSDWNFYLFLDGNANLFSKNKTILIRPESVGKVGSSHLSSHSTEKSNQKIWILRPFEIYRQCSNVPKFWQFSTFPTLSDPIDKTS